jgi:DNA-binding GntR family transcriptional regulator
MSTTSELRPATAPETSEESPFGTQISRESVGQQAYVAIRNSLMRSRLKPGQRLVARQVADELGISVTPVRESLLRLVSEHALALDERGTVIVPILTLERCIEIRDLRMLMEGEGAARAAKLVTASEIDELSAIHDRYVRTEKDNNFAVALAENENFHFGLCRLARSPALFRIVENLWMQFGPILAYLYDSKSRPFHGQKHGHIRVIEALRKRDPELARKAISQDILIGGRTLLDKLKR